LGLPLTFAEMIIADARTIVEVCDARPNDAVGQSTNVQ